MGHGWRALGKQRWCLSTFLLLPFSTLQKNLWHMWVHPNGVETTGALDLGGASTQISFAAEEKVGLNTSSIMKVSLYGYVYTLYTHSFQCYGRNEAEKRFLAILLQVPKPGWGGREDTRYSIGELEGGVLGFWGLSLPLQLECG